MTSPNPVLELKGLRFCWPEEATPSLPAIDLSVRTGEIACVLAPHGSGKSEALLGALGLGRVGARIVEGSYRFRDREMVGLAEPQRRAMLGRELAVAPQRAGEHLPSRLSMADIFVRSRNREDRQASRTAAWGLLRAVGVRDAQELWLRPLGELSRGKRQLIALALALSRQPKLLIADDPLVGLDARATERWLRLLRQLNRDVGTTLLFLAHDMGELDQLRPRVIRLHPDGTPTDTAATPLVSLGRSGFPPAPGPSPLQGEVVMEASRLGLYFSVRMRPRGHLEIIKAVDGVSLQLRKGQLLGLCGENGAGKTLLARLLAGQVPPTFGQLLWPRKQGWMLRLRTGGFREPEGGSLLIEAGTRSSTELLRAVQDALALLPRVLILDGVLAGLRSEAQQLVHSTLRQHCRERGLASVLIEADPNDLGSCDRLLVLSRGRIVEDAPAHSPRLLHPVARWRLDTALPAPELTPRSAPVLGGCPEWDRCPRYVPATCGHSPPLLEAAQEHWIACSVVGSAKSPEHAASEPTLP